MPLIPRGFFSPYAPVGVFILLLMIWVFVRRLFGYKPEPDKQLPSKPWKRKQQ